MAVNIGSLFYGPELDPDFKDFTDSGHCAQVTAAVVVDTLDMDLRYILVPMKNGITIRIAIDRALNLAWYAFGEKMIRRERALAMKSYSQRKIEAKKKIADANMKLLLDLNEIPACTEEDIDVSETESDYTANFLNCTTPVWEGPG